MEILLAALAATDTEAARTPNLWGALGCAMAYAAARYAAVESFADLSVARGSAEGGRLNAAMKLKLGAKLAAAGVTVVAAGLVLTLDANWFAFTVLTAVFVVFVAISVAVVITRRRPTAQPTGSATS